MKSFPTYSSLLASAAVVLAGSLHAQSDATSSAQQHAATQGEAAMEKISRVSKESIEHRLTAKDLIGASVYDPAGEKIGDIADVDLHAAVPEDLAKTFETARASEAAGSTYGAEPMAGAGEQSTMSEAGRRLRGMASALKGEEPTVFISVGGLWGVGDDVVSVPVSQLKYNAAEERFELSASKADIVALAGQEEAGSTAAAKQQFSDDAMQVQDALASDPQTSSFAHRVTVTTDGETIELRGTLDNEQQQQQVLDAARRATSLPIEDNTDVRE